MTTMWQNDVCGQFWKCCLLKCKMSLNTVNSKKNILLAKVADVKLCLCNWICHWFPLTCSFKNIFKGFLYVSFVSFFFTQHLYLHCKLPMSWLSPMELFTLFLSSHLSSLHLQHHLLSHCHRTENKPAYFWSTFKKKKLKKNKKKTQFYYSVISFPVHKVQSDRSLKLTFGLMSGKVVKSVNVMNAQWHHWHVDFTSSNLFSFCANIPDEL